VRVHRLLALSSLVDPRRAGIIVRAVQRKHDVASLLAHDEPRIKLADRALLLAWSIGKAYRRQPISFGTGPTKRKTTRK
jgi:hypothetical protein